MSKRSFYIPESMADDYQQAIIAKKVDRSMVVKGCAGSGKSLLALWKTHSISSMGLGSVLFVVFNRSLQKYITDGLEEMKIFNVDVQRINKCFKWSVDENNQWVMGPWSMGDYDYIIVDEAQDLTEAQIQALRQHARKSLALYGDSAQQLYKTSRSTVSMEDIGYITRYPLEQLVFNHRLPRKIARLAECLNPQGDELVDRCKTEGVNKPYILYYPTIDMQLDAIQSIIENQNLEDVGILFSRKDDISYAKAYLEQQGCSVEVNLDDKTELNFESTNPKLMTYQSSKGLQFETVFLPNCNEEISVNALYVAMTRAYQTLYIMHSGDISPFLAEAPNDLYEESLEKETEYL